MAKAIQYPYIPLHFMRKDGLYYVRNLEVSKIECYGKNGQVMCYVDDKVLVSCGSSKKGVEITCAYKKGEICKNNLIAERKLKIGEILL